MGEKTPSADVGVGVEEKTPSADVGVGVEEKTPSANGGESGVGDENAVEDSVDGAQATGATPRQGAAGMWGKIYQSIKSAESSENGLGGRMSRKKERNITAKIRRAFGGVIDDEGSTEDPKPNPIGSGGEDENAVDDSDDDAQATWDADQSWFRQRATGSWGKIYESIKRAELSDSGLGERISREKEKKITGEIVKQTKEDATTLFV